MATTRTFVNRDRLVYLYGKYEGDYDKIMKALEDKEEIDPAVAGPFLIKFYDDPKHKDHKFLTLLDAEYPEWLKALERAPHILEYEGDLSALDGDHHIVALENGDLSAYCAAHGVEHAWLDPETSLITYVNGEQKLAFVDREGYKRLMALSETVLALSGEDDFVAAAHAAPNIQARLSLPGVAGSGCNQLIKQGWYLCDSANDLLNWKEVYKWHPTT